MFVIVKIGSRDYIDRMYKNEIIINPELTVKPEKLFGYAHSGSFRDVHVYDRYSERIQIEEYKTEFKHDVIKHLRTLLVNENAIRMIDIILSRDNYDPINDVNSSTLLTWICTHDITPELFYLLEEQLSDNYSLGTCLQGSSARIRQVFYAQVDIQGV
jgi:hypothetical protein